MKPPVFLVIVSAILIIGATLFRGNAPSPTSPLKVNTPISVVGFDPKTERALWENKIKINGAEKAYAELKETYRDEPVTTQHLVAHLVGELIYENLNLRGVTVCDQDLAFGCYHSFLAKAIAEHGIAVVKSLDTICVQKYGPLGTGCQHGIGHGILESVGHTNLNEALESCHLTTQVRKLLGCTSGVFMEYNFPGLADSSQGLKNLREPDMNNLEAPCNTIASNDFQLSCYFELAEWWRASLKKTNKEVMEMCEGIENPSNRDACIRKAGNNVAIFNKYEKDLAIRECDEMQSPHTRLLCRAGAAWAFFANPLHRKDWEALCPATPENDRAICLTKANLAAGD